MGTYETTVSIDGGSNWLSWATDATSFPLNQFTRTYSSSTSPKYNDYSVTIEGTADSFRFRQLDVANSLSHEFDVKFVQISINSAATFWDPSHARVTNDFFHTRSSADDEVPASAVASGFNLDSLSDKTTI